MPDFEKWKVKFNEWRNNYDNLSYQDNVKFYSEIQKEFPDQVQFKVLPILSFFREIKEENLKVFELGGWKGELATKILEQFKSIETWHNFEICKEAADNPKCSDKRYESVHLEDFVWNSSRILESYNVAIFSHVLEHMKKDQIKLVLNRLPNVKYIYMDTPIYTNTSLVNWHNYIGTHILEIGMNDLLDLFENYKYHTFRTANNSYFLKRD